MASQTYSVGPGAAADILERVRTRAQLEAAADEATFQPPEMPHGLVPSYSMISDEVQRMVKSVIYWQPPAQSMDGTVSSAEDATWGFALMVTASNPASQELLPRALDNWIALLDRQLRHHSYTLPVWAAEAQQRLRLEVVQDPKLANASDEDVRTQFRELLRSRSLLDENDLPPPPSRNMACLVLDAATIAKLADLTVPDDARPREVFLEWEHIKVRFLDLYWSPEDDDEEDEDEDGDEGPYRGTGQVSVNAIASFYGRLSSAASGDAMREMHPVDGFP